MSNSQHPDFKAMDPEGREISIASDENISEYFDTDIFEIFCREVLGYEPDEILVTDESSIGDFPEDLSLYNDKIKELFGIELPEENPLIWKVIKAITESRKPKY